MTSGMDVLPILKLELNHLSRVGLAILSLDQRDEAEVKRADQLRQLESKQAYIYAFLGEERRYDQLHRA